MKLRLLCIVLVLGMLWPAAALAADDEPQSQSEAVSFTLDNANVYDGMDKAYKHGYAPAVKKGTATIVLPLLASGSMSGNTITVTPGLGDPSASPFVFKNYHKSVRLADNDVNGGSHSVSSYLVRFDLALSVERINGNYPVTIDVQATASDGSAVLQSFTCYVTVTDGKDPNATEPTPKPEKAKPQPKVIVSDYTVNPEKVPAGEAFTATVTLKNTSASQSVKNMTVTVSSDCPQFSLLDESGTIYIESLGKDKTVQIVLKYNTDMGTPAMRYNITLSMEYNNSDAASFTSSGTVPVDVSQPLRVEMETPQIAKEVNAGDTMPLSFQVMNLGRGIVYNVRIKLDVPGLFPSETAFIGNMEGGTSGTGNMNVFVGTKNMSEGAAGSEMYGHAAGKATLTYEDEFGEVYTSETEISTTINEPVVVTTGDEPQEDPEKAGQWWVTILVGGILVSGLAVLFFVRKRKQRQDHETI